MDASKVTIRIDGEHECTLAEFLADNEDGLDPEEIEGLESLEVGESFTSGGGAWASWTVERLT